MLVVKRGGSPDHKADRFVPAYELYGTEEELLRAHCQLTSIALQAISQGSITPKAASELLKGIENKYNRATILGYVAHTFINLITRGESLAQDRREQLLYEGVRGNLGALTISNELAILDSASGGPFNPDHTSYCNEEYLSGMCLNEDGSISPEIKDFSSLSDDEYNLAKQLPVTHTVTQFQLRNRAGDVYRHSSVGTVDEREAYHPYATIIDPRHPARYHKATVPLAIAPIPLETPQPLG